MTIYHTIVIQLTIFTIVSSNQRRTNNSNPFFSFYILLHFDNAHCHILSQLEQTSFKLVFSNQVYICFWVAYIDAIAIFELSYDTKQNI